MARPQKEGLDYFPLDVGIDQDDKLILPIAKFGMQGFGIIVKLMMEIYKNGYFRQWSERERFLFAKRVYVDINVISDVVNECINWGFFHQELFEKYEILTSSGFQKRYIEAAKRRKEITMFKEYVLVDAEKMSEKLNVAITVIDLDRNTVNVYKNPSKCVPTQTEIPQSKVNKSKVNKSKNTSSRQSKTYDEDSTPYRMAKYLHSRIMEYAESIGKGHLVRDAKLQKWADECRKILEIDKRDKEEVKKVIDWATSNAFWRKNILSAEKLRDKYADLCIKMADDSKQSGGGKLAEEGSGRKGDGRVLAKGSRHGGEKPIEDDELDELQRQSLQMLEMHG
ncbi:DUF4373 domain-containing protein [Paenibacillus elgii]|uniref:DUF4373 domain-containing protein n=1 Tax=Paenibacillus elgii TaxID=189691 RepID=UPI00203BE5C8|nr:DUF4373 domain-containing protein [Paenibacillus elgii]MCM3273687.1 DUF4373 domain-containing protein [Paenibacillus elgii]